MQNQIHLFSAYGSERNYPNCYCCDATQSQHTTLQWRRPAGLATEICGGPRSKLGREERAILALVGRRGHASAESTMVVGRLAGMKPGCVLDRLLNELDH